MEFVKAVEKARAAGISFDYLATSSLARRFGETGASVTAASLGREALKTPEIFAKKMVATFGHGGTLLLQDLTEFAETEARRRRLPTF